MAARVIDISRMSEKQIAEMSRRMRRDKDFKRSLAYRAEAVDERVFAPLAEAIAKDGSRLDMIEKNFRATKFRHFENIRGDGFKSHISYYLGFLFETAVQMSILRFSQENPELLTVLRNTGGIMEHGQMFSVDSRGSAVFFRDADNGRAKQTIAEIDLVGEIHEMGGIVPVIFEITLMNGHRKDFKNKRKSELLEEMYGRKPYFCVVRPAYNEEETGVSIEFSAERGVWRNILTPRNDAIRALAARLLEQEHEAKENEKQAAGCGA
jgi:hypothetical protein